MTHRARATTPLDERPWWEVVGGYVLAAWIALQVSETVASLVGLPLWFGKAVLLLLGAGLAVVLATALLHRAVSRSGAGAGGWARLGRLLTWRRIVWAGVAGFAVLGITTAGSLAARSLSWGPLGTLTARGLLAEQPAIVLADLEDATGDPALASALTQALRVELAESPSLRLVSPAHVGTVMGLMGADESDGLSLREGREVAIREGLGAVVGGELHRVGSGYSLSVVMVAAESGDELARGIETVAGPDHLIAAVERLGIHLRERVGESLRSLRGNPPLDRVRTASLAALRSYTEAVKANSRGDFEQCALLSGEALELDTLFAMAYVARASCNQNLQRDIPLQIEDRTRAYRLRDRMTDRERLHLTAVYLQHVEEDRSGALEAWRAFLARFPESATAHFALANLYAEGREWERAETTLLEGLARDSSQIIVLLNLSGYRTHRGRYEDAETALDDLEEAIPGIDLSWHRARLALASGDLPRAHEALTRARAAARSSPVQRSAVTVLEALLAWTEGRFREGDAKFRQAAAADSAAGSVARYHHRSFVLAWNVLRSRADTTAALEIVRGALEAFPFESVAPVERRYFDLAAVLAAAGRVERAREVMAAWERDVGTHRPGRTIPHWLQAVVAESEGRLEEALRLWSLEDATREDRLGPLAEQARLHDRLGRPDSALALYRRYLTTPSQSRPSLDALWRGPILERVAELLLARGETRAAARRFRELSELWAGADPSHRTRVERAARYAEVRE